MTTYLSGVQTTGNILQAERVVDIPREIEWVEPDNAPLVKLTKGGGKDGRLPIKKKVAINPEFKVLEKEPHGAFTAVGATFTAAATTITLDDSSFIKAGDILQVVGGELLQCLTNTLTTNTITATRSVGPTAAAEIANNCPIYRIGNAKEENSAISDIVMVQNRSRTNYLQILDKVYGLSRTAENSEMYGGPKGFELNKEAWLEHEKDINRTFYWSEPYESLTGGVNGYPLRLTGGLAYWIESGGGNVTTATTTFTKAMFLTFCRTGFNVGNDTKVLLAAPLIIEMIEYWKDGKLEMRPSDRAYDLKVFTWETGNGTVLIVRDRDLKNSPAGDTTLGHGGCAFLVDPPYLSYRYLNNSDSKLYENAVRDGHDGKKNIIRSEVGLELRIPEAHSMLESVATYA
jgi:hypothetical protein